MEREVVWKITKTWWVTWMGWAVSSHLISSHVPEIAHPTFR
jgi:hypothetical protein